MANEVYVRVKAEDQASATFKKVGDSANSLGATLGKVGAVAGGFLAANVVAGGFQKFTGFIGDSINAASDLGESINAVNKIFGTSSDTILKWGDTQANAYGLSQRAFNQMAVPLGAGLRNAGLETDKVAELTVKLTERAADMASVFNTDVDEALAAIQAGLRGEADPLERFGVGLSAAKVEAHALAMTGKTVAASLTEQEKALARVDLLMVQTQSTAGDFASTSGELANATRIQQARMEELQATIGQKLIPVQLKITEAKLAMVNLLATKVIPILEELYAKHWPAISAAIQDVVSFVQANWPLISEVIGFVADYVITRIEGMIQVITSIVEIVSSVVNLVSAIAHGDWARAWQEMKDIAGAMVDLLVGQIKATLGNLPETLYNIGRNAGSSLVNGIKDAIGSFVPDIPSVPSLPSLESLIPGFAVGTPYVPRDMLAIVHKGEAIIPADQNRGGVGGVVVNNYGPVYAADASSATGALGDIGWGISLAMGRRGLSAA